MQIGDKGFFRPFGSQGYLFQLNELFEVVPNEDNKFFSLKRDDGQIQNFNPRTGDLAGGVVYAGSEERVSPVNDVIVMAIPKSPGGQSAAGIYEWFKYNG